MIPIDCDLGLEGRHCRQSQIENRFRPLGIPVIFDRVLQTRAKNALEPEWL